MKRNKISLLNCIPYECLEIINGVRFTPREIDVVACLLSGRATKTVAHFLSIEEKTVETHKYNIMRKLECNSKESIINFIEKSDKFSIVKKHYLGLLIQATFEKRLQEISTLIGKSARVCAIVYWRNQKNGVLLVNRLEKHLKLAGFKIIIEIREDYKSLNHLIHNLESQSVDFIIYIPSEILLAQLQCDDTKGKLETFPFIQKSSQKPESVVFLLMDRDTSVELPKVIQDASYVDFEEQENYYFAALDLLKKVLPDIKLEKTFLEFQKHYEVIYGAESKAPHQIWTEVNDISQRDNLSHSISPGMLQKVKGSLLASGIVLLSIFCILFFIITGSRLPSIMQIKEASPFIRSELPLPQKSALLERLDLIAQIEEKFKGQHNIQTLALVGMGGSGKTTLARQYAHSQKSSIISEINAETEATLTDSFERLAYEMAQTEEDKNVLKSLQAIDNPKERREKVVELVKRNLKLRPNWFLIYDNVEQFADVQRYFPADQEIWGEGRAIITTRDDTIQNNSYVNNVIHVGELAPAEMLSLFSKIMNHERAKDLSDIQGEREQKFLSNIPPFPLDVCVAAYYIKVTGIMYEEYLEHLNEHSVDFEGVQEKILKESSDYTKTRYSIIALSVKHLIDIHKDFEDLLLLISLLDSQSIPRDFLNMYKKDVVVDNFIYHLKKYSLIEDKSLGSFPLLSIHRSLQAISLIYLTRRLDLKKRNQVMQNISDALEGYINQTIDKSDFSKMNILLTNCKVFMNHKSLLTDIISISIGSKLGEIYSELGYYEEAVHILNESLANLNKFDGAHANRPKSARILAQLGNVYRKLGDYKKAKSSLENSLIIYKKHSSENYSEIADALAYLGNVYRCVGQYKQSKDLFEQSFAICKKHFPENHTKIARMLAYLGNVNRNLGYYEEAKSLLEQSLAIYNKYLPGNYTKISWTFAHLGIAYIGLGDYEKAKSLLEQSLEIYKKYFSENHINTAWVMEYLGVACAELGHYESAENLLKQSLTIHERVYGKDHIETARVLRNLGRVYIFKNADKIAEDLIFKALKIFEQNNHPEAYTCMESLAELNMRKYDLSPEEEKISYKNKAVAYLNQALKAIETHYSKDSPHANSIKAKLKTFH